MSPESRTRSILTLAAAGVHLHRAEDVLSRRKGVCYGYANLFTALAGEAGLDAHTVTGIIKSAHPEAGLDAHAWNAVRIDGQWLLLDTAWRRFLSTPESFIKSHFPGEAKWKYLDPPVSRERFDSQLAAGPGFYECGMTLIHPPVLDFGVDEQTVIVLGAPAGVHVHAAMGKKSNEKLPGRTVGWDPKWTRERTAALVLVQRRGTEVEIAAAFPEAGLWYIGVQAGREGDRAKGAVSINITVDRPVAGFGGFPRSAGDLTSHDFYLVEPRRRRFPDGEPVRFVVESGQARDVLVLSGKYHRLEQEGSVFSGEVTPVSGPVRLVADLEGKGCDLPMLEFEAR